MIYPYLYLVTFNKIILFVLQGAIVLDFVCRIKLEAAFVVTGVKVIMQYISPAEKISLYTLYKRD